MNKKPVHEIRLGSVKAAVWLNTSATGTRHLEEARQIRDFLLTVLPSTAA